MAVFVVFPYSTNKERGSIQRYEGTSQVLPLQKAMLKRGTKSYGVVLTQAPKVLVMVKGVGTTNFHPLKEGQVAKQVSPAIYTFCSPPPPPSPLPN